MFVSKERSANRSFRPVPLASAFLAVVAGILTGSQLMFVLFGVAIFIGGFGVKVRKIGTLSNASTVSSDENLIHPVILLLIAAVVAFLGVCSSLKLL